MCLWRTCVTSRLLTGWCLPSSVWLCMDLYIISLTGRHYYSSLNNPDSTVHTLEIMVCLCSVKVLWSVTFCLPISQANKVIYLSWKSLLSWYSNSHIPRRYSYVFVISSCWFGGSSWEWETLLFTKLFLTVIGKMNNAYKLDCYLSSIWHVHVYQWYVIRSVVTIQPSA